MQLHNNYVRQARGVGRGLTWAGSGGGDRECHGRLRRKTLRQEQLVMAERFYRSHLNRTSSGRPGRHAAGGNQDRASTCKRPGIG